MIGENGRTATTKSSATTESVVDWFANVVQTDTIMPVGDRDEDQNDGPHDGNSEPRGQKRSLALIDRITRRYRRLPGWILIPQIFLAFAWGRAGIANALDDRWWSGQRILDFLATETGLRVDVYQHVLTGVVERMPAVTAAVVVIAEVAVAVLLLLNIRPAFAIGLAVFLNLQFLLAGAVNPSVFYLVAALGIAIWRLETFARPETVRRLSRNGLIAGVAITAFLAPSIRTFRPEGVIEDPALVLIFLSLLSVTALWWVNRRMTLGQEALAALTEDGTLAPLPDRQTGPSPIWLLMSAVGAVVILFAGFGVLTDQGRSAGSENTPTPESAQAPGAFGTPYPFGLNVTMSYNDLTDGLNRTWQVQVLETVLDGSNPIQSDPATDGQLAMARVRLTYQQGAAPTPADDIRFQAVGSSGTVFSQKTSGCGSPEGRLNGDKLDPGQAVEGWICWPVPTDEVASLVMAVEAEPADGVLYMSLQKAAGG